MDTFGETRLTAAAIGTALVLAVLLAKAVIMACLKVIRRVCRKLYGLKCRKASLSA
jgi:hypothetical protein